MDCRTRDALLLAYFGAQTAQANADGRDAGADPGETTSRPLKLGHSTDECSF